MSPALSPGAPVSVMVWVVLCSVYLHFLRFCSQWTCSNEIGTGGNWNDVQQTQRLQQLQRFLHDNLLSATLAGRNARPRGIFECATFSGGEEITASGTP